MTGERWRGEREEGVAYLEVARTLFGLDEEDGGREDADEPERE